MKYRNFVSIILLLISIFTIGCASNPSKARAFLRDDTLKLQSKSSVNVPDPNRGFVTEAPNPPSQSSQSNQIQAPKFASAQAAAAIAAPISGPSSLIFDQDAVSYVMISDYRIDGFSCPAGASDPTLCVTGVGGTNVLKSLIVSTGTTTKTINLKIDPMLTYLKTLTQTGTFAVTIQPICNRTTTCTADGPYSAKSPTFIPAIVITVNIPKTPTNIIIQ